jgi:hypothetical protein
LDGLVKFPGNREQETATLKETVLVTRTSGAVYWFILVSLTIGGTILLLAVTHQGIGLGSDSAVYISAGRNFIAGRGLIWITGGGEVHPMTHFPPFFPLVLSAFELFGVDSIVGARFLNSLLFGVNIILVGVIIKIITRSRWFSIFGAFLVVISIFMIRAHSWAMSEPLYLTLGFGGLVLLAGYIKNYRRTWLIFAGIVIGLAYLTRYLGVSLILVGLIGLVGNWRVSWRRRFEDATIFLLTSMPLNLLWMLRNEYQTGYSTSRSLRIYLPSTDEFMSLTKVVLGWFIPSEILGRFPDGFLLLGLSGFLLVLGVGIVSWLKREHPQENDVNLWVFRPWLGSLLAFHIVAFFGVIVASSVLIYPPPALDYRIFIPLYVTVIILIVWGLSIGWKTGHWALRAGAILFGVVLTASYTIRSHTVVTELLEDAQGYSGSQWRSSQTITAVQRLPQVPLYSNRPGALYLLADRQSYTIPYLIPQRVD